MKRKRKEKRASSSPSGRGRGRRRKHPPKVDADQQPSPRTNGGVLGGIRSASVEEKLEDMEDSNSKDAQESSSKESSPNLDSRVVSKTPPVTIKITLPKEKQHSDSK